MRALPPVVEAVAKKYEGAVRVVKVNVDESVSVSQRYGIKGIPTLILFNQGEEKERVVGATSVAVISQMIERSLSAVHA